MKRILMILFFSILGTGLGVYLRPSYFMIGQLDWVNVLTKGYFASTLSKFFGQGLMDESFFFVMRFTIGGALLGFVLSFALLKTKKGKTSSKKKKAN